MSRLKIALMGAGGKMGTRISDNIRGLDSYEIFYLEASEQARQAMAQVGLEVSEETEALEQADVIILALPDKLIGAICEEVVPKLKSGSMVMSLDPAAGYAGVIPIRDDLSYFVTHPCHAPLFNDEVSDEARNDWFGGVHAKQHIVCSLHHGSESDYVKGEQVARDIYAPVMESFRVTTEEMAILEPALVETVVATFIVALKEALESTVDMGVNRDIAEAFMMGHIRTIIGSVFGYSGFPLSDGANLAIANAYAKIFKADWKEQIFTKEAVLQSVQEITGVSAGSEISKA